VSKMMLEIAAEKQKAAQQMNDSEDSLIKTGFSLDQWMLIKEYILSAILHNQMVITEASLNLPEISPEP
jgi:hypothetical protein